MLSLFYSLHCLNWIHCFKIPLRLRLRLCLPRSLLDLAWIRLESCKFIQPMVLQIWIFAHFGPLSAQKYGILGLSAAVIGMYYMKY